MRIVQRVVFQGIIISIILLYFTGNAFCSLHGSVTKYKDSEVSQTSIQKLKQYDRSVALKKTILQKECIKSTQEHTLLIARVHLSLAEHHYEHAHSDKAQEHINAFFLIWNSPDPDLPLYKRAVQVKESI